jgi:predicted CoA-substrate-specific enzyme activase
MTQTNQSKTLGICIGASSVKTALLRWDGDSYTVEKAEVTSHECNPKQAFFAILENYRGAFNQLCVTGRKFKDLVDCATITEPEATELALKDFLRHQQAKFNALISLGSENFILYELDTSGNIINVRVSGKCASGTGEFFLQQIRRMNVDVQTAIALAQNSEPYKVSGRCSVFCKSDCTHALNKGIPIGNVSAGLGSMIGEKVLELLHTIEPNNILLAGGVANNNYVVNCLKEKITNLKIVDNANIFEALGAAIYAHTKAIDNNVVSLRAEHQSFTYHPPLKDFLHLVTFKEQPRETAQANDECIIGLDVGSTTTKAVLLRIADNAMLASVYLRTNGNPIKATRECYAALQKQIGATQLQLVGLGVTGSGRHIAGLHALTEGIINEIIAHATAATFYDNEVDTILEIGGQDAKYTYLVNGVACDYAMNEACSAGTGSFLEEAAKESLNIDYLDIQNIALQATRPPNFNDQCAAFISSDIKNASHENIRREDIIAGLVYSICMNYNNRVKGARKIGKKIFMQGGVCYNQAVPIAMAGILQKPIVVPPDPGLMGAFGVALEIKNRINLGLYTKTHFSLAELIGREVTYGKSFSCSGDSEKCDRNCQINIIQLNGKNYPFGGICNKYYNQIHHLNVAKTNLDLVAARQRLIFGDEHVPQTTSTKTIGLLKSFQTNTLYPLYYHFFTQLGLQVLLSDKVDSSGLKKVNSTFCFPVEISHGMLANLLQKKPDYLFLPQILELKVENSLRTAITSQSTCVFVQAEASYLKSAFRDFEPQLINPVLNFANGWDSQADKFIAIGALLGVTNDSAKNAYFYAVNKLKEIFQARKELGDQVLDELAKDPSKIAIVLFGRAYNAFADEANLGVPKKFASRNVYVIPYDCLRYDQEFSMENMGWATGQELLKATRLVKNHPQLFGTYITNFSCGPDSFLVGYFRDIMQTKPSLTLEMDSHSADAGINTRIEAFLDIVDRYRALNLANNTTSDFVPASMTCQNGKMLFIDSDGNKIKLPDKRATVVIPSMGRLIAEAMAAAFNSFGFTSAAVPIPDFKTLMLGRSNTSCKECLPLTVVTGSLLEHLKNRKDDAPILYFMPTTSGNCRFSQYYVFLKNLIAKQKLKNVALFTLSDENNYAGIGAANTLKCLQAIVIADVMDDIRSAILALAINSEEGMKIFEEQWQKILQTANNGFKNITATLKEVAKHLSKIPLKRPLTKAKKVIMCGEIFVRKDNFSSDPIVKSLAQKEIVVLRSPVLEWMLYIDHINNLLLRDNRRWQERLSLFIRSFIINTMETKCKMILATSGLYEYEKIDMAKIVDIGKQFVPEEFVGETILGIGAFFKDIIKHVHGFISVGPFACLPTRIIESILTPESKALGNKRLHFLDNFKQLESFNTLPFISIECDGNPFPQVIESRIEAFCLQVERVKQQSTY